MTLPIVACNRYQYEEGTDATTSIDNEHLHRSGAIASLAGDKYHAEAFLLSDRKLAIHLFGSDETRMLEVPQQVLNAYVKTPDRGESIVIALNAEPFPHDAEGMTSRFSGTLPERLADQSLSIMVPGLRIDGERFAARFEIVSLEAPAMPIPVADEDAKQLYLTAGGLYTEEDIAANGGLTAGEKYRGFRAQHDAKPVPGDRICPITQTKANPQCSWIIGGEPYYFCCPPCIDEFLMTAKISPEQVLASDVYRNDT